MVFLLGITCPTLLENLTRRVTFGRLVRFFVLARLKAKGRIEPSQHMSNTETNRRLPNYLRVHRRRAGLAQYELALAIGYENAREIARHEQSVTIPPLELAIGYEIIFRVPVSELFAGLRDDLSETLEPRLAQLELELGQRSAQDRNAGSTARKLTWLKARKCSDYDPLA